MNRQKLTMHRQKWEISRQKWENSRKKRIYAVVHIQVGADAADTDWIWKQHIPVPLSLEALGANPATTTVAAVSPRRRARQQRKQRSVGRPGGSVPAVRGFYHLHP